MSSHKTKKLSSRKNLLKRWKQVAIDNCILRGLLELRAEKQQEKIEFLEGTVQDLKLDKRYLTIMVQELGDLVSELESEIQEYQPEENEYDEYEEEDDEDEDYY